MYFSGSSYEQLWNNFDVLAEAVISSTYKQVFFKVFWTLYYEFE